MSERADLRQRVLAYRLGELSPEDRGDFQARMSSEESFRDRVQQTEFDLVDDFRAGRMTAEDRRRMEEAFTRDQLLPAPAIRLETPAREGTPDESGTGRVVESSNSGAGRRTRQSRIAWGYWTRLTLATAGLILLAAAIWIALRYVRPREAMPKTAQTAPALTSSAESEEPANGSGQAGATAVLLLAPAVTRATMTAELHLRPSMRHVRVQWVVPPEVRAREFELRIVHGRRVLGTIHQHNGLREIGGSRMAEFRVEAQFFSGAAARPDYVLSIRAVAHPDEVLGEYPITVTRD